MKVAIINSVYKFGSTGRISFELAEYFKNHGIETRVFYGRKKQFKDDTGFIFSSPLSTLIDVVKARLFDCDGFSAKQSTRKLILYLESFNPDIIIIHNLHGYYINLPMLFEYTKENSKKIVAVTHDCWLITGHCAHFDSIGCQLWKTCCKQCPLRGNYPKSILLDRSSKNYKLKKHYLCQSDITLVHPSNWISNTFGFSFLESKKRFVIHNGIDTNIFKKTNSLFRKLNGLESYKLILCVANVWTKEKGIQDIYKLSQQVPSNYKIIVVGKVKKKQLSDKILFLGVLKSVDDLVELYSTCDVFFNPTYEDTFPTVNMEAQSCELPVISYNTGGSTEMIDINFSVKQGDISTALLLMKQLFAGEKQYSLIKKEVINKTNCYDKYLKLIKEVIK